MEKTPLIGPGPGKLLPDLVWVIADLKPKLRATPVQVLCYTMQWTPELPQELSVKEAAHGLRVVQELNPTIKKEEQKKAWQMAIPSANDSKGSRACPEGTNKKLLSQKNVTALNPILASILSCPYV